MTQATIHTAVSRRSFLQASTVAGGGLMLGVSLPSMQAMAAGTLYTPDGIKHSVEGAAKRLCPVSAPPEAIRIFGEQLDLSVWPFSAKAAELIGPATMNDNAKPASSSAKRL